MQIYNFVYQINDKEVVQFMHSFVIIMKKSFNYKFVSLIVMAQPKRRRNVTVDNWMYSVSWMIIILGNG